MITRVSPTVIANTTISAGTYGAANSTVIFTVDSQGRLTGASNALISIANTQITGLIVSSQIANVANTNILGLITPAQIANVFANQISGQIQGTQIASMPANKLSTQITTSQILSIANTQIDGLINANQIITVSNTQITGLLNANQIANVSNVVITGLVTANQVANVYSLRITGLINANQIANVTNTTITGVINANQINTISNTQVTGLFSSANLTTTGVTAGNYGSATTLITINVDSQGRITSAANATPNVANNQIFGVLTSSQLANTTVANATHGYANSVATFTVDQQGRLVYASNVLINIANTQITGNIRSANIEPNLSLTTISDQYGSLRSIPQNSQTASYVLANTDNGRHISITSGNITIPNSVFGIGNVITIFNNKGSSLNIANAPNANVVFAGRGTYGNTTLAQFGLATILCYAANSFVISGTGLN